MARVRIRVARRGRVELHEVDGPDVSLGREPGSGLELLDDGVAPRHALLLARRGRLILVDLGLAPRGVALGGVRAFAPTVLEPHQTFMLGELELSARLLAGDEPELRSTSWDGRPVALELCSADPGVRRLRLAGAPGEAAEVSVLAPGIAAARRVAFFAAFSAEHALPAEGRAPAAVVASRAGADAMIGALERLPEGLRLDSVLAAARRGAVRLPVEACLVILAQVARALELDARRGGHGALCPAFVQLGLDGSVTLLRPGPSRRPEVEAYLAPERRYGLDPSSAADAFALGRLAADLLGASAPSAPLVAHVPRLLVEDPVARPSASSWAGALVALAHEAGLDPTGLHVGRVVRLLYGELSRPLARRPRDPA
jgi:hypothetical protein